MVADDDLAIAYAREEAAVLTDLQKAGVSVKRLPELLGTRLPPSAASSLLAHLKTARTHAAREILIRAITDRTFAATIAPELAAMFEDDDFAAHRWTLGQALAAAATPDTAPLLIKLARSGEFGRDREMIVLGLSKTRSAVADQTLIDLLNDDSVAGHAVKGLASLTPTRLRALDTAGVNRFLDDPRPWVRRAASAVLKKAGRDTS